MLCVSGSGDAENDGMDDYLTVFEQADTGCIDQWSMILHEQAGRFGARGNGGGNLVSGVDGKEVVSVRWVGEPRAVSNHRLLWSIRSHSSLLDPLVVSDSGIYTFRHERWESDLDFATFFVRSSEIISDQWCSFRCRSLFR